MFKHASFEMMIVFVSKTKTKTQVYRELMPIHGNGSLPCLPWAEAKTSILENSLDNTLEDALSKCRHVLGPNTNEVMRAKGVEFLEVRRPIPGNIQGTFREQSECVQGTFRGHSGNIQGTFRGHSGNIQKAFRERSEDMHGTFEQLWPVP
jgi:hypothetical protein